MENRSKSTVAISDKATFAAALQSSLLPLSTHIHKAARSVCVCVELSARLGLRFSYLRQRKKQRRGRQR